MSITNSDRSLRNNEDIIIPIIDTFSSSDVTVVSCRLYYRKNEMQNKPSWLPRQITFLNRLIAVIIRVKMLQYLYNSVICCIFFVSPDPRGDQLITIRAVACDGSRRTARNRYNNNIVAAGSMSRRNATITAVNATSIENSNNGAPFTALDFRGIRGTSPFFSEKYFLFYFSIIQALCCQYRIILILSIRRMVHVSIPISGLSSFIFHVLLTTSVALVYHVLFSRSICLQVPS